MARIKVKITAETVYSLDTSQYQDAWEELCDDVGDREEGDDYPPMPPSFALERFQEELEEGGMNLALLEDATIDVREVQ